MLSPNLLWCGVPCVLCLKTDILCRIFILCVYLRVYTLFGILLLHARGSLPLFYSFLLFFS